MFAPSRDGLLWEEELIEAAARSVDKLGHESMTGGSWVLWLERVWEPWNAKRSVALRVKHQARPR
jgi:hypothetical protein